MLPGTPVAFKAPIATEWSTTRGVPEAVLSFQQCITFMPEYENKSLEELRFEDYVTNRKGGSQTAVGGLGATGQDNSIFAAAATQKPAFNFCPAQNIGTPAAALGLVASATTVKFHPRLAIETPMENGATSPVYIAYQCITCMAEYENKSLEELRLEVYAAMGTINATSQQNFVFCKPTPQHMGTPLFDVFTKASTSAVGINTAVGATGSSVFGQPQHKPNAAFSFRPTLGSPATAGGFAFRSSTTVQTSMFGASKATFSFDSTVAPASGSTTASLGGFSTPSTATGGLFGAPKTTPTFGTGAPRFGSTFFGTTPTFGTLASSATGGLFGINTAAKPAGFGFVTTTTTISFGGGSSTHAVGPFGAARPRPSTGAAGTWGVPSTGTAARPTYFGFGAAATATTLQEAPGPSASSRHGTPGRPLTRTEDTCPICLDRCVDRAFVYRCFHTFCLACIARWTRVKAKCPVCNQHFQTIIHSVRSMRDYQQCSVIELRRTW